MIPPHVQPLSSPGDIAPHPGGFRWCWKQASFYLDHVGMILFHKVYLKTFFFFFSHFQNSLTWSLSEHFTMFSGRSQACSIESADLDEVMSVWQHVLQPGLVDRCGDKYAVCSRFWMVILRPVLNLEDSEGKIVKLRAVTMW